jgi:hypothetical protein
MCSLYKHLYGCVPYINIFFSKYAQNNKKILRRIKYDIIAAQ